jgi:Ni,Fe-hydrogenase I small subunit
MVMSHEFGEDKEEYCTVLGTVSLYESTQAAAPQALAGVARGTCGLMDARSAMSPSPSLRESLHHRTQKVHTVSYTVQLQCLCTE